VPELWKTPRTRARFPQARWTRPDRAPTRSTRHPCFFSCQEEDEPDRIP
jgi:hypothetical protein